MKLRGAWLLLSLLLAPLVHAADKVDLVVVEKSRHLLTLYRDGHRLASYHVVFGHHPLGPKQRRGDSRTPEGRYVLDRKQAHSGYYKAFHISYPDANDRARARQLGVPAGGDIMVHGQKNGYGWAAFIMQRFNWTDGCIALSDADMDALWQRVDAGTPIVIRP